jgi:hypothetical protein
MIRKVVRECIRRIKGVRGEADYGTSVILLGLKMWIGRSGPEFGVTCRAWEGYKPR